MNIENIHDDCTVRRALKAEELRFGKLLHSPYGCRVTFMYLGYCRKTIPMAGSFPGVKPGYQFLQITGKPLRGEGCDY